MRIKELTFVLENCERITVDGKYIGDFLVDDIRTYVSRLAMNWVDEMTVADTVVIELHKDANKEHNPFGAVDYQTTVFERLFGNDITYIGFTLFEENDGVIVTEKEYDYSVNWCEDNDFINKYQKTYRSEQGNLYLVINKEKDIDDFFNNEDINDEEMMDFHFDMYDVGDEYSNPDRYKEE